MAHVKWGSSWQLPSLNQAKELIEYCSHTWTAINGVEGELFTSQNGGSIFMPAAGIYNGSTFIYNGRYSVCWTGSGKDNDKNLAYYFSCHSDIAPDDGAVNWVASGRCFWHSVRPLWDGQ